MSNLYPSSPSIELLTNSRASDPGLVSHYPWEDTIASSFHTDGFFGPIEVYKPEQAKALLSQVRIENVDRSHVLFDNDVNYDRHFDCPTLAAHIAHPTIAHAVGKILGRDLLCWRTEFFPKFPGSAGTEWHQVRTYAYAAGAPMLASVYGDQEPYLDITVWTAFTDATLETACMKFLPGSHRRLYYDESKTPKSGRGGSYRSVTSQSQFFGYEFDDFKIDPEWMPDEAQARAMPMRAGECVIFTPTCVHASFPNTTRRTTRFAITARYIPPSVRVYPGWKEFQAHGGQFKLDNYGCVVVSGEDRMGVNRLRATDNWGNPFPHNGV